MARAIAGFCALLALCCASIGVGAWLLTTSPRRSEIQNVTVVRARAISPYSPLSWGGAYRCAYTYVDPLTGDGGTVLFEDACSLTPASPLEVCYDSGAAWEPPCRIRSAAREVAGVVMLALPAALVVSMMCCCCASIPVGVSDVMEVTRVARVTRVTRVERVVGVVGDPSVQSVSLVEIVGADRPPTSVPPMTCVDAERGDALCVGVSDTDKSSDQVVVVVVVQPAGPMQSDCNEK